VTDNDDRTPDEPSESLSPQIPVYDPLAPIEGEGGTALAAVSGVDDESTVGMGTTLALGCIAGTVLLIILALILLGLNSLL
jgi:hypothetical protein